MIKLEVIKDFTMKDYYKLSNVKRTSCPAEDGLYKKGDTFECDEETTKYLMGGNAIGAVLVKIIEVEPPKETKKSEKKKKVM